MEKSIDKKSGDKEIAGGLPRMFLLGLLANLMLVLVIRYFRVKFPLDLIIAGLIMYAGMGIPVGLLIASWKPPRLAAWAPWISAGLVLLMAAAVANESVTTHYLLGEVYYPYPFPQNAAFHVAGILIALAIFPVFFVVAGALIGKGLKRCGNGPQGYGAFALGMAAGAAAGHFLVPAAGVYFPMIACSAVAIFLFADRRSAIVCAAALVAVGFWSTQKKTHVFFTWKLDHYDLVETRWTDYYRLDFITFSLNDAECVSGVYNTLMLWYICDADDYSQAEFKRVVGEATRGKKRMLVAGRTDGHYAQVALNVNGGKMEKIDMVEYDKVATELTKTKYARYAHGLFDRPEVKTHADDIRQFLAKEANRGEKYDAIFLHGIGLRLAPLPRSVVNQEDYLTSRESYDVIFNKLLSDNGVFVIDWGSSVEDEVYPMFANIPDGVNVRAFHTWLGEFPLTGTGLFFVVASRDKKELDRIADELLGLPSFKESKFEPKKIAAAKFDDDKPFHHKPLKYLLIAMLFPIFALLAAITVHIGFRARWQAPVTAGYIVFYAFVLAMGFMIVYSGKGGKSVFASPFTAGLVLAILLFLIQYVGRVAAKLARSLRAGVGEPSVYFWLAGAAFGMLEACLYSRASWLMPGGPGPGVALAGAVWLGAFGASLLALGALKRIPPAFAFAGAAASLVALPWFTTGLHGWVEALAVVAAMGVVGGVFWAAALGSVTSESRPRALCLLTLGAIAGLYFFQLLIVFFGYRMAGAGIGVFFLATACFYAFGAARGQMGTKSCKKAEAV